MTLRIDVTKERTIMVHSDDKQGENMGVLVALDGALGSENELTMRWEDAPMEGGTLAVKFDEVEAQEVLAALEKEWSVEVDEAYVALRSEPENVL